MRGICGPLMATAVGLEAIPSTSSPSSSSTSSSSREKSKRKFRADLASPPGAQFFQQEENHHQHQHQHHHHHHHHQHDGDVAAGNGNRGEDGSGLVNWGPDDAVSRDLGSKSKSLSLDGDGGVDVEDGAAAKETEECVHKVDGELGLGGGGGGGDGMGRGMGGEVGVGLDAIVVGGGCCEELENNWKTEPEPELEELLVTSLEAVFNDVIRKIVVQGFSKEEALKVFSKQAGWLREGGSVVPASIVEDALTYLAETGRRISCSDPNNVNNNAPLGSSNVADDGKALQRRILFSMLKKLRENRPALSRGDAMWCLLMSDMNVENALSFEDNISHSPLQLSKTVSGSSPSPSPSPFPNPSPEGTNPAPVSNASTEILAESCSPVSSSAPSNGEILRASSIPPSTPPPPPPRVEGLSAGEESRASRDLSMGQKQDSSSLESSFTPGCLPTMVVADWSQATRLEESINKTEEEAENRVVGSEEELQGQGSSGGSGGEEEHLSNSPGKEVNKNLQQEDGGSSSISPSDERDGLPDVGSKNQQRACSQPEGNSPQSGAEILVAQSPLPGASVCTGPAETNLSLGVSSLSSTEELQGSDVKRGDTTTVSTAEGQDASSQDILASIDSNVEARRAETLLCLQIRIRDLEMQLVDRTEWAQQKVMQAARRLSKDRNEMNSLRAERDELMRAKKDQKTLEDNTMKKLADMEAALRRASGQVDRANQAVSRLEKENAEVRAEMEAAKLNAAESMELCQEVAKKEKKDVKKAQCWEKQKAKLQESLAEERAKVTELKQQLVQAKELQQQAEVSRRQEEKAKEDAVKRANDGKRLREKAETDYKKREDALRRNAELDKRRLRDDIDRLSQELSTYKATERAHFAGSSWGSSIMTVGVTEAGVGMKRNDRNERLHRDDEDRDVRRDRECVMCMYEEVSVVFLPCAHQVVCAGCDEVHKNHGISNCPSCRTPIQQRIRVYGPS